MKLAGRFKTVIFDFDGVILDSARLKTAAFAEVYRGEAPSKIAEVVAYQERHGGIGRKQKFEYFERELFGRPGDPAAVNRLCESFAEIIDDAMMGAAFVAGAKELLDTLFEKLPMHVVSGMPEEDLHGVVQTRGLSRFFKSVAGSPKSKRGEFSRIMEFEKVAPGECLAVGDSLTEFHAARELGIPFLAVVAPDVRDLFPSDVEKVPDLTEFFGAVEQVW